MKVHHGNLNVGPGMVGLDRVPEQARMRVPREAALLLGFSFWVVGASARSKPAQAAGALGRRLGHAGGLAFRQ